MYTYTFITYTSLHRRGPCDAERVEYVHPYAYHLVRVRVRIGVKVRVRNRDRDLG